MTSGCGVVCTDEQLGAAVREMFSTTTFEDDDDDDDNYDEDDDENDYDFESGSLLPSRP